MNTETITFKNDAELIDIIENAEKGHTFCSIIQKVDKPFRTVKDPLNKETTLENTVGTRDIIKLKKYPLGTGSGKTLNQKRSEDSGAEIENKRDSYYKSHNGSKIILEHKKSGNYHIKVRLYGDMVKKVKNFYFRNSDLSQIDNNIMSMFNRKKDTFTDIEGKEHEIRTFELTPKISNILALSMNGKKYIRSGFEKWQRLFD